MKKDVDLIERMLGKGNFEINSSDNFVPKKVAPIKKIEPEFVPVLKNDLFGMDDESERKAIVGALKKAGVERVNFCYPLNDDISREADIIEKTIHMAKDFSDSGFLVSVCNIDSTHKIDSIKEIVGDVDWVSYLNKNYRVPEVEKYCRKHNIPFVPSASDPDEIADLVREGYPIIKAIPYVDAKMNLNQPLYRVTRKVDAGGLEALYNAAGGVRPVRLAPGTNAPASINDHFKAAARLDSVVLISATQPTKTFLYKSKEEMPIEKIGQYFDLINEFGEKESMRSARFDPVQE